MSGEIHWDVASYALGVLDDRDAIRFEEHLASCAQCGLELESLLPVVGLLAEVDGRDLVVAERAESDGALFERTLTAVGEDRRRARSRRLYSLAAGVVVVVMLTGLALFVGTRIAEPTVINAQPPGTGSTVALPSGPDSERFDVTDRVSGLHAEVVLRSTLWGTEVTFALSKLTGPRTCRMVLLGETGPAEVVSSWNVPTAGYGTAAQPNPLLLQAATAVTRDKIDQIQVQVIDDKGAADALVTIPV